mgnify:CR=1 FL=1
MESKLIKGFHIQHKLDKLKKLQQRQRLKSTLIIGVILCLMTIIIL